MHPSLFISSDAHLCKFLQVTGGNWRNTIFIECGECPRAISRRCKNMLCAFDSDGTPVLVPEKDLELLWDTLIDKSECLAVLPRTTFCELYRNWLNSHIRDPHTCPMIDLHLNWGTPDCNALPVFNSH